MSIQITNSGYAQSMTLTLTGTGGDPNTWSIVDSDANPVAGTVLGVGDQGYLIKVHGTHTPGASTFNASISLNSNVPTETGNNLITVVDSVGTIYTVTADFVFQKLYAGASTNAVLSPFIIDSDEFWQMQNADVSALAGPSAFGTAVSGYNVDFNGPDTVDISALMTITLPPAAALQNGLRVLMKHAGLFWISLFNVRPLSEKPLPPTAPTPPALVDVTDMSITVLTQDLTVRATNAQILYSQDPSFATGVIIVDVTTPGEPQIIAGFTGGVSLHVRLRMIGPGGNTDGGISPVLMPPSLTAVLLGV